MIDYQDISSTNPVSMQHISPDFHAEGADIDSRRISPGMLFIARKGETTDGHRFIGKALQNGAEAAIVEQEWYTMASPARDWPLIVVPDADIALRELASAVRQKVTHPVFGITGSNGKTTTKEMLAAILSTQYQVLATSGNFNNLWGLPLTILQARDTHNFWVLEHGMNRPGEIAELCAISKPTSGLVTTVTESHSHLFDSADEIAETKFAMYRSLPADGVAFQNRNDPRIAAYTPHTAEVISYGIGTEADFRGEILQIDNYSRPTLSVNDQEPIKLKVSGEFQALNATAAAAVASYYATPHENIKSALESFSGVAGRTKIIKRNGRTIIDDAYNANPASMKAALAILAEMPADNKRVAVLGDMLELNENQRDKRHREIGRVAAESNVDVLIGVGPLAKHIIDSAASILKNNVHHFEDYTACLKEINQLVTDGDVILVKGSHGIHLENVVEAL